MAKTKLNDLTYTKIQQRTHNDCGIACIAMYARVSYEDAHKAVLNYDSHMPKIGVSRGTMIRALKDLGVNAAKSWQFFDGIPCIVSVPSLNTEAAMHSVFWNGNTQEVYDPQAGKEAKKFYTSDLIYKGWSTTVVDIDAAAEGMGVSVAEIKRFINRDE